MHISKWYLFIKKAVEIMNRNLKIKNLKKKELANFYLNNKIKFQFFGIPENTYTYNIKDSVLLKSSATKEGRAQQKNPGFKRSIGKQII